MRKFVLCAAVTCALSGCAIPVQDLGTPTEKKMTLGTVQQSIHKGMSQSQVIEALGSPNMVTRDKDGVETWVYDKSSTTVATSHSSVYGTIILLGATVGQSAGVTSQRTLTLILKFKDAALSDFTYRYTSF